MSTTLTLRPFLSTEPPRAAGPPERTALPAPAAVTAAAPAVPVSATPAPNPRLRLDGALGMVVIEFRGNDGEVAASIPTERELAAYRRNAPGSESKAAPAAPEPDPEPATTH